jgi:hypothetical protein
MSTTVLPAVSKTKQSPTQRCEKRRKENPERKRVMLRERLWDWLKRRECTKRGGWVGRTDKRSRRGRDLGKGGEEKTIMNALDVAGKLAVLLNGGADLLLLLRRTVVRVGRLGVGATGSATVPRLRLESEEGSPAFFPLHQDETRDAGEPVEAVSEDGTDVGVVSPSEDGWKRGGEKAGEKESQCRKNDEEEYVRDAPLKTE